MKRLREAHVVKAPLAKPKEATYTRTWDDDHKPTMTEGIYLLAAAQLADKMQMSLEDAQAQLREDFNVVKAKIRVRPSTMAKAAWTADHEGMAAALAAAREAKEMTN